MIVVTVESIVNLSHASKILFQRFKNLIGSLVERKDTYLVLGKEHEQERPL